MSPCASPERVPTRPSVAPEGGSEDSLATEVLDVETVNNGDPVNNESDPALTTGEMDVLDVDSHVPQIGQMREIGYFPDDRETLSDVGLSEADHVDRK